ncbi:MAG: hypothetical protein WCK15_04285 [Pirellula sp.]
MALAIEWHAQGTLIRGCRKGLASVFNEMNPTHSTSVHPNESTRSGAKISVSRSALFGWTIVYTYPLLAAICFYSSWMVAWVMLGHVPRPMLDDPKSIGGIMDFAYLVATLSIISFPILTPLFLCSSFFCPLRFSNHQVAQGLTLALAYIWLSAAIAITIWYDPGRVVEWWLD